MGQLKWYKRDPSAALNGMMELTLEERGAFNTVLDLIYSRDGNLPDDEHFIAGWLRVDVRIWRRIRASLITRGKLFVADGALRNERADAEVLAALSRVGSAREAGRASARSKASRLHGNQRKTNSLEPTDVETSAATVVSTNHNHYQNSVEINSTAAAAAPVLFAPADDVRPAGAPPKPGRSADDVKRAIFASGLALLIGQGIPESRARSMIGRWRKDHSDGAVLDAIIRAEVEQPSEVVEWINARLNHSKGKRNGQAPNGPGPMQRLGAHLAAEFTSAG